jgi:hypothetical protein
MSTQLIDRPTTTIPVTDPAWGAAPPPVGPTGVDAAGGGRPATPWRLATPCWPWPARWGWRGR